MIDTPSPPSPTSPVPAARSWRRRRTRPPRRRAGSPNAPCPARARRALDLLLPPPTLAPAPAPGMLGAMLAPPHALCDTAAPAPRSGPRSSHPCRPRRSRSGPMRREPPRPPTRPERTDRAGSPQPLAPARRCRLYHHCASSRPGRGMPRACAPARQAAQPPISSVTPTLFSSPPSCAGRGGLPSHRALQFVHVVHRRQRTHHQPARRARVPRAPRSPPGRRSPRDEFGVLTTSTGARPGGSHRYTSARRGASSGPPRSDASTSTRAGCATRAGAAACRPARATGRRGAQTRTCSGRTTPAARHAPRAASRPAGAARASAHRRRRGGDQQPVVPARRNVRHAPHREPRARWSAATRSASRRRSPRLVPRPACQSPHVRPTGAIRRLG